jgi:hypothetical protein
MDKPENGDGNGQTESDESKVEASLAEEISAAVDSKVAENKKLSESAKPPVKNDKKDVPPVEDPADDEGEPPAGGEAKGKESGEGKPAEHAESLIERAVKAGMSIGEAKSFQDAKALERICDVLEKKGAKTEESPSGDGKAKEDDPLSAIPDLDPEIYDEKLVGIVKTLKDIIRGNMKESAGLRTANETTGNRSWFDQQVDSLGDAFEKTLGKGERSKRTSEQRASLAALEDKFAVLEAGYRAAGKQVDKETIFKEAVSVALGDVQVRAEAKVKADQLATRRLQHLNRPSGASVKANTDPMQDIADKLDRKFFGKR